MWYNTTCKRLASLLASPTQMPTIPVKRGSLFILMEEGGGVTPTQRLLWKADERVKERRSFGP